MCRQLAAFALFAILPSPSGAGDFCDPSVFAESRIVSEAGVELFARAGGQGEPAVVVPGDFLLFDRLCALAARHRVIFYDMRNRGRSSPIADGERLTLEADLHDLAAIVRHFGLERPGLIGYSYLGKMVVAFALAHPGTVSRIVQIGPVPMDPNRTYPPGLREPSLSASGDFDDEIREIRARRAEGLHEADPEAYCELEWNLARKGLVGDPSNAKRIASRCHLPNEWPTRLVFHMQHHFLESMLHSVITPVDLADLELPVLTIHGTKDRNAPYGSGREWAASLPGARLSTMEGMAHAVHYEIDLTPTLETFFGGAWPAGVETVEPATDGQRSQLQAWDFAHRALALHAPDGVPAQRALDIEWRGTLRPRSQSRTSEPPFEPPFPVRWKAILGAERRRLALVEELEWPNFLSRHRSIVTPVEAFDVDLGSGVVTPSFREPDELLARIVRYLPPLLLAEILRQTPGSLRFGGVVEIDGERFHALSASHRGTRLDLLVATDGALAGWSRMVSETMLGDAYETVRFYGVKVAAGLRLPTRITRRLATIGVLADLELVSVSLGDLDPRLLERPADPGLRQPVGGTDRAAPATSGTTSPTELAPGVFLFSVPGNPDYRSLVVERPDHLVLVEAPVGEEATGALLEELSERFPDKPLRWVVATHHHFDHSGGVPKALESGATLVTTPGNTAFFRRAVVGPETLNRRLEPREPPKIVTVHESRSLPGGAPHVEVLRLEPTPHATEMIAVYLPDAKLLFQGDLVRFPLAADEPLRPQVRALWNLVASGTRDVDRIAGVHGDVGTAEQLRERIVD